MKIAVDDVTATVRLIDPDRFTEFCILAAPTLDPAALDSLLRTADAGYFDGQAGFIAASWIQGQVSVTPEWLAGFTKMVEFADSHGWLTPDGSRIQAHVEYDTTAPTS
jgi:hypothetical protein